MLDTFHADDKRTMGVRGFSLDRTFQCGGGHWKRARGEPTQTAARGGLTGPLGPCASRRLQLAPN